jgi:hypothetical protein
MIRSYITVATVLLATACGENFEAGLANAPSIQRQNRPRSSHDVIANGQESCPRRPGDTDPLVNRTPPCEDIGLDAGAPQLNGAGGDD